MLGFVRNKVVENPGNAPGMACLQGGPGPLSVPRDGAQGRFRAHLSAFSAQRFHQISSLGELERPAGIDPASQRWHHRALPLSYGRIGGCGTDSNLHSTEAPGYSRPGFPIPYTPEIWIGCRSASRTRRRTAYETARAPGLPAGARMKRELAEN